MPANVQVAVHHVARVEGHGDIVVDVQNGEIKQCRFEVVEAPRFFEAFVRGRPYDDALTERLGAVVIHETND